MIWIDNLQAEQRNGGRGEWDDNFEERGHCASYSHGSNSATIVVSHWILYELRHDIHGWRFRVAGLRVSGQSFRSETRGETAVWTMTDKISICANRFSMEDCISLSKGIKKSPKLRKFSLTRSNLDRPRVAIILHGMKLNNNVSE